VQVSRVEQVPYLPSELYKLVNDIETYSNFLPWCSKSEVLNRDEEAVVARLYISRGGFQTSFTTRNVLVPDKRIDMHLLDGPFKKLHGVWTFEREPQGCRVEFDMEFKFSAPWTLLGGPLIFSEICDRMVEAFIEEAARRQLPGP